MQPTQITNVVIPLQNITTVVQNITQPQNTVTILNIFNLTSQLIRITTRATAGGIKQQNNIASIGNTEEKHFPHFSTIGANPFGGFEAFRGNNNNPPSENNNNNNPLLLPLPEFGRGLGRGFNSPSEGNAKGLDLNVVALVN